MSAPLTFSLRKRLQGGGGVLALELAADVPAGAFATVFGPSGAGKTSLLRMLAGLMTPDEGRIAVGDEVWFDSARRIDLPPQKRSIGFVFQDQALFPNMNVRANVAYAAPAGAPGLVDELLAATGLDGLADARPAALSGGQKQRVALARALARRPRLLLLDEPLSAIDAATRARLQDLLADMHRRHGLTTLLVSHDLGEVFRLSDRVLQIEAGRFAAIGSPAELFLRHRVGGRIPLRARVLAVRREDVVHVAALLFGNDVVEVIVSDEDAARLAVGREVEVSAKAFSPLLFSQD